MVKLRLRRIGKKKHPVYRVVAADTRSPRDGRYIEAVGSYDPNLNPMKLNFKDDRIVYWLSKGAQPTDTVRTLFQRSGLWLRWSLIKRGADEAKIQSMMERWQMAQQDRMKRESERKERRAERKRKAAAESGTPAPEKASAGEASPAPQKAPEGEAPPAESADAPTAT